jgi:hypothetical protein
LVKRRVTRLAEFLSLGRLSTLGCVLKVKQRIFFWLFPLYQVSIYFDI